MSQFKVGDWALVIRDVGMTPCGSVVQLVGFNKAGFGCLGISGETLEFNNDVWEFSHESIPAPFSGFAPEHWLMPLQGDFAPEQQKSREVVL